MTTNPPIDQTVAINFVMADPEGTAPIRVVAAHATRVGEDWLQLGQSMMEMADSLDELVAGSTERPPSDGGEEPTP